MMPGVIPNVEFRFAYIVDDFDPTKSAKVRLSIDGLTGTSEMKTFTRCLFPFGQKGPLRRGQQVGCLIVESVPGSYTVVVLGAAYASPSNTGSKAPLANDPDIPRLGPISASKYAHLHITEVDPASSPTEAWVVKIKGQRTAIIVDAARGEIAIDPGGSNVVLVPGEQTDARVAVEGDPVVVQSPDGPLRGRITFGSAPMVARKIS
jgi:hypothetical protein